MYARFEQLVVEAFALVTNILLVGSIQNLLRSVNVLMNVDVELVAYALRKQETVAVTMKQHFLKLIIMR